MASEPAETAPRTGPPAWIVVIPLIILVLWILEQLLVGH